MTKSDALKLEYRIKQLPANRKIAEINRTEMQMTVKHELKALQNEFKALGTKVEKLLKTVEKAEKDSSQGSES